jgi:acyl-CoA thioesterase FadM
MSKAPIVYKSTHRIKFSELDPYNHVNTGNYATFSPITGWRVCVTMPAGI